MTIDHIRASVQLAESIASTENKLLTMEVSGAPQNLVLERRTQLGALYESMLTDAIAEKLLPQARNMIHVNEARLTGFRNAFLGKMIEAVANEEQNVGRWMDSRDLFSDSLQQHYWDELIIAIETGDKNQILAAVAELLSGIQWDLMELNIPPPPPYYRLT